MGEQPLRSADRSDAACPPRWRDFSFSLTTCEDVKPQVLWIDDEVRPDDAIVAWMSLEGLEIVCESSGVGGLERSLTRRFDAIILDLRLPDISGQDILERLAAASVLTPVVVLTGYADFASGVAAMKAGARDVKCKPVMGDEFAALMKHVIAENRAAMRMSIEPRHQIDAVISYDAESAVKARAMIAMMISAPSALEFVKLTERLRRLLRGHETHVGAHSLGHPASATFDTQKAERILGAIERELTQHRMPQRTLIATLCGITVADLTAVLASAASLQYRQCRRALRLRGGVAAIAFSREQIAQIAYALGYDHPSQLDRDFSETFGISPTSMRNLCR